MPDFVGNISTGRSGQCPGILSGHLCPDTGTVAAFPSTNPRGEARLELDESYER